MYRLTVLGVEPDVASCGMYEDWDADRPLECWHCTPPLTDYVIASKIRKLVSPAFFAALRGELAGPPQMVSQDMAQRSPTP